MGYQNEPNCEPRSVTFGILLTVRVIRSDSQSQSNVDRGLVICTSLAKSCFCESSQGNRWKNSRKKRPFCGTVRHSSSGMLSPKKICVRQVVVVIATIVWYE